MISVEKIKDLDTGGKHTELEIPVLCEFNRGLGFTIAGIDPLKKHRPKQKLTMIERKLNDLPF